MQRKSSIMTKLKAEYETLSEIQSQFGRNSRHKVAQYIDKRLGETLKAIESLKPSLQVYKSEIKEIFEITKKKKLNKTISIYYKVLLLNGDLGVIEVLAQDSSKFKKLITIYYCKSIIPTSEEIILVHPDEIEK